MKPKWLIDTNDKRLLMLSTEPRKRAYYALTELENEHGIFVLVLETRRDTARQTKYYAQGRSTPGDIITNAKPGYSFHEYDVALDVVPLINFKCHWVKDAMFKKVGEVFRKHGFEWGALKAYGGDFNTIDDWPHMQMRFGLSIRDFKAGKRPPAMLEDQAEFVFALERLRDLGIMRSPDFWLQNAIPGKMIPGEYARSLIISVVRFINKVMKG